MSHKGVVLKEIHLEGVKDYGPEVALVLNFNHYYCTYEHMDSVKRLQSPLWSLSLEVYNLSTTTVSSYLQFPYVLDRCPILISSGWQNNPQ